MNTTGNAYVATADPRKAYDAGYRKGLEDAAKVAERWAADHTFIVFSGSEVPDATAMEIVRRIRALGGDQT